MGAVVAAWVFLGKEGPGPPLTALQGVPLTFITIMTFRRVVLIILIIVNSCIMLAKTQAQF